MDSLAHCTVHIISYKFCNILSLLELFFHAYLLFFIQKYISTKSVLNYVVTSTILILQYRHCIVFEKFSIIFKFSYTTIGFLCYNTCHFMNSELKISGTTSSSVRWKSFYSFETKTTKVNSLVILVQYGHSIVNAFSISSQ